MKKYLKVALVFTLILSLLIGCIPSVYKKGVVLDKKYPEEILPIFYDAVVYYSNEYKDEITIRIGTPVDLYEVKEYYKELIYDNDDILILYEDTRRRDEYEIEGLILSEMLFFEIEIDEAVGYTEKKIYETQFEISVIWLDEYDFNELLSKALDKKDMQKNAEDTENSPEFQPTATSALNITTTPSPTTEPVMSSEYEISWSISDEGKVGFKLLPGTIDTLKEFNFRLYIDNKLVEQSWNYSMQTQVFQVNKDYFVDNPPNIVIEIIDENDKVISKTVIDDFMVFDAKGKANVDGIAQKCKDAKSIIIFNTSKNSKLNLSELASLTNIKKLVVVSNNSIDISALSNLKYLTFLTLDSFGFTIDLSPIVSIKSLEKLLIFSIVNDISPISSLTNLTKLSINFNALDLSPIASLTKLESLLLSSYDDTMDLTSLIGLKKLVDLSLWTYRKDVDITPIASLTALESIFIKGISSKNITPIASLSNLKILNLYYCEDLKDISAVSSLKNLEEFQIAGCNVTNFTPLSNLKNIKSLKIFDSKIDDIAPILSLKQLKKLVIDNYLEKDIILQISTFTNLEDLTLQYLKADDLTPFSSLSKLKSLNIWYCENITDLSPLINLKNLETLSITKAPLLSNLEPIYQISTIKYLSFSNLDKLKDISPIAGLYNITNLSISNCKILIDISPISSLSTLLGLKINSCESIKDISPITNLNYLKILDIQNCISIDDYSPLDSLSATKIIR